MDRGTVPPRFQHDEGKHKKWSRALGRSLSAATKVRPCDRLVQEVQDNRMEMAYFYLFCLWQDEEGKKQRSYVRLLSTTTVIECRLQVCGLWRSRMLKDARAVQSTLFSLLARCGRKKGG